MSYDGITEEEWRSLLVPAARTLRRSENGWTETLMPYLSDPHTLRGLQVHAQPGELVPPEQLKRILAAELSQGGELDLTLLRPLVPGTWHAGGAGGFDEWSDYFPTVNPPYTDDYPVPLTPEFWRSYREDLLEFLYTASALVGMIETMGSAARYEGTGPRRSAGAEVVQRTSDRVNRYLATVSPVLMRSDGTWRQSWRAPSLVTMLSAMAVFDGLGTFKRCPVCGAAHFAERPDKEYCSTRCKATARKRRQRQDKDRQAKMKGAKP